jgi:hypothetical protein
VEMFKPKRTETGQVYGSSVARSGTWHPSLIARKTSGADSKRRTVAASIPSFRRAERRTRTKRGGRRCPRWPDRETTTRQQPWNYVSQKWGFRITIMRSTVPAVNPTRASSLCCNRPVMNNYLDATQEQENHNRKPWDSINP